MIYVTLQIHLYFAEEMIQDNSRLYSHFCGHFVESIEDMSSWSCLRHSIRDKNAPY